MQPLDTRTRIIIVQHVLEQGERSNTAKHALAALINSERRLYGAKDEPLRTDDLHDAWLLFPGEGPRPPGTPGKLLVLDGSWSQARHMIQRVPLLRTLPRFSITPKEGRRSLREAPTGGMSTLEALAEGLRLIESDAVGAHLDAVHEALLQKQLNERGYVGKGDWRGS